MIVGPKLKLNSQYEPTPTSNGKLATFNFEFPPKVQVGGLWGSVSAGLRVAGSRPVSTSGIYHSTSASLNKSRGVLPAAVACRFLLKV